MEGFMGTTLVAREHGYSAPMAMPAARSIFDFLKIG
jgi:hypothetical protein